MCPTCGYDMQCLSLALTIGPYWCQQCGTIGSLAAPNGAVFKTPKLVERCRELDNLLRVELDGALDGPRGNMWRVLGIAEAINKPEDRT